MATSVPRQLVQFSLHYAHHSQLERPIFEEAVVFLSRILNNINLLFKLGNAHQDWMSA